MTRPRWVAAPGDESGLSFTLNGFAAGRRKAGGGLAAVMGSRPGRGVLPV